jgi:hypothetical protein
MADTTVGGNTPRLLTRLLAATALVGVYLFGTIGVSTLAMTLGAAAEEDEEEEDVGEEGAAAGVEEEGAAFACFSVWCGVAARPRVE